MHTAELNPMRRALASLAIVLLIIVAGYAVVYAVRSQAGVATPTPTAAVATPTATATAAPPTSTSAATTDSGVVNVCGPFNAYMPASSGRNAVLSMGTPSGLTNFELVLNGTVPPDLQQNGAQLVRLTGRRVQGVNTVADYNVVRVSSCSAP
jgi:hypothetical protein